MEAVARISVILSSGLAFVVWLLDTPLGWRCRARLPDAIDVLINAVVEVRGIAPAARSNERIPSGVIGFKLAKDVISPEKSL
jgi:hypothetical protein